MTVPKLLYRTVWLRYVCVLLHITICKWSVRACNNFLYPILRIALFLWCCPKVNVNSGVCPEWTPIIIIIYRPVAGGGVRGGSEDPHFKRSTNFIVPLAYLVSCVNGTRQTFSFGNAACPLHAQNWITCCGQVL